MSQAEHASDRNEHNPILGIDLGTTNSLVAISDERGPRVLHNAGEDPILPSVVRYEPDPADPRGYRPVLGTAVADEAPQHPLHTVSSVKRLMGRSVGDVGKDTPYFSYRVVAGEQDTARVEIPLPDGPRVISPQEVSAAILAELKSRAERALGREVRRAVVTVPAYFDDAQRQATRDAGRIAGLEVVRIVNEPTAAALAYGIGLGRDSDRNTEPQTVAVYDLGGGRSMSRSSASSRAMGGGEGRVLPGALHRGRHAAGRGRRRSCDRAAVPR
jgi:molecular chaperone HscA